MEHFGADSGDVAAPLPKLSVYGWWVRKLASLKENQNGFDLWNVDGAEVHIGVELVESFDGTVGIRTRI